MDACVIRENGVILRTSRPFANPIVTTSRLMKDSAPIANTNSSVIAKHGKLILSINVVMSNASYIPETIEMFQDIAGTLVPKFGGITFQAEHDQERLGAQLKRVLDCMSDGNWRTLSSISKLTGDPEASVSARLRDFRKLGRTVERRRRGLARRGNHEYRLLSDVGNNL